jgi:hypothetical protein
MDVLEEFILLFKCEREVANPDNEVAPSRVLAARRS